MSLELQKALREPMPLHEQLRVMASTGCLASRLSELEVEILHTAAAEIEGHNQAFEAVVEQKHEAQTKLSHVRSLLRGRDDFIDRWRTLLVALRAERPDDVRIKRALVGEDPMKPAAWERTQSKQK